MPNLGPAELIIILAIALIVFGPKKLPEIGKGIGNAMREFTKARNDFMDSLHADPDHDKPAHTVTSSYSSTVDDTSSSVEPYSGDRKVEFPEPLAADDADALPYGSDFQAVEGDSQPSFRTTEPEAIPVAAAASSHNDSITEERKVS